MRIRFETAEALEILKKEPVDLLLVRISLDDRAKELFGWLSRVSKRPKLIFVAPAWSAELLAWAAIVGADGVLRSRVPEEVAAAVAAHLCS